MRVDNKKLPDQEYLKSRFDYNPETGDFRWRPIEGVSLTRMDKRFNTVFAGKKAGGVRREGTHVVDIDKKTFSTNRVIYKLMTGKDPSFEITCVDKNRTNLKWSNLKDAHVCVRFNSGRRCFSTSPIYNGVRFVPENIKNPFRADINLDGKHLCLGVFPTLFEAVAVRISAENKIRVLDNWSRSESEFKNWRRKIIDQIRK